MTRAKPLFAGTCKKVERERRNLQNDGHDNKREQYHCASECVCVCVFVYNVGFAKTLSLSHRKRTAQNAENALNAATAAGTTLTALSSLRVPDPLCPYMSVGCCRKAMQSKAKVCLFGSRRRHGAREMEMEREIERGRGSKGAFEYDNGKWQGTKYDTFQRALLT